MSKEILTPETIILRNESKFLTSSIGDEIVMMNVDNGDYIGINSVGGDIWNLLIEPIQVKDLIKRVIELYDVSEEQAHNEITGFLQRMLNQKLILLTSN